MRFIGVQGHCSYQSIIFTKIRYHLNHFLHDSLSLLATDRINFEHVFDVVKIKSIISELHSLP